MTPLVSILIPAYNSAAWIADTIRAAVNQTWPRKEIIVVDDGSRDNTLSVARTLESPQVKVVGQENQGASAARNRAYSLCQGDYIQWLDADDLMAPDKIEQQMRARRDEQDSRTLLASAWGTFAYRTSRAVFTPTSLWADLSPHEWMLRCLAENVYMQTTAWLVSRELCEKAGPWDTRLSLDDDGEYIFRVLLACERVKFVAESRAYYRRLFSGSLSRMDRSDKKWESQFLSIQLHIQYLLSVDSSQRARAACLQYLRDWTLFFYPERMDLFEKMRHMATELGGSLEPPRMPWKYHWIQKTFGWELAKRAQSFLPGLRWSLAVSWDRLLAGFEKRPA